MKLKVRNDTFFKLSTKQSSELGEAEKVLVNKDTEFEVHSHAPAENNHVKVALADATLGPEKRNTWYIFSDHIAIQGNEPNNRPDDKEKPSPERTDGFKLPGFESTFYLSNPIIANSKFTWADATKNGTRIPVSKEIVEGIIKIAKAMDEVNTLLGNKPIIVNSWYRDPVTNQRVGGASASRHLSGDAVDFVVEGIHPFDVYDRLDPWWGNRGGIASATVFTHIDARGYSARWDYGF
ncbi:MAG: D-Ala-D-Ala carboxypeptidase family metallohydrolase [Leptolyngbyaceae bacterium]|nr:D-Ala-D-Ala carboxypeptidase family metallohydrolase [Leptolyngbyaceae bacterium]